MVFFCGLVGVKSLGGAYTYWYCSDNFVYLLPEVRELIRDTKPRTSTTLGSTVCGRRARIEGRAIRRPHDPTLLPEFHSMVASGVIGLIIVEPVGTRQR